MAEQKSLAPTRTISQRLRHRRHDWVWRRSLKRHAAFPEKTGRKDPNFPGLAVVTIAVLPKYHDWCLSMIDSLRRRGDYHGPIYVVTENPAVFDGLDNVRVITVPYTRYRLVIKSCKQLLLDWVDEQTMLYIDADIVIGKPLHEWYARAADKLVHKPLVLYPDEKPLPGAYHGGIMLVDRERARPFFQRWLKLIRTGRYLMDQQSLYSIRDTSYIDTFDDDELSFMHKILGSASDAAEADQDEPAEPPRTFVHVTNGMIRKYSAEEIKAYLRRVVGLERMPTSFGRDA